MKYVVNRKKKCKATSDDWKQLRNVVVVLTVSVQSGYSGKHCEIMEPCKVKDACLNGGTCIDLHAEYRNLDTKVVMDEKERDVKQMYIPMP